MAYLPLSWDHRALDGAEAARFLGAVKERARDGSGRDEARSQHPSAPAPPASTTRSSPSSGRAKRRRRWPSPIHSTRARPGAGRRAHLALRARRRRRSPTRCGSPRAMTLQGRRRRARPGRRQGRDLRAVAEPPDRRAAARDPARLRRPRRVARTAATSPPRTSAPRTEDMVVIATRTAARDRPAGRARRRGRPEPVHRARRPGGDARRVRMRAFGTRDLGGRSVAVVGLGHVGEKLARGLRRRGRRARRLRHRPRQASAGERARARAGSSPTRRSRPRCDVVAPCAVGRRDQRRQRRRLRCRIVCGAANNQLADERARRTLARARHPLRARLHRQRRRADQRLPGAPRATTRTGRTELALGIEPTMAEVFEHAESARMTPLEAAADLRPERLDAAPDECKLVPRLREMSARAASRALGRRRAACSLRGGSRCRSASTRARRAGEIPDVAALARAPARLHEGQAHRARPSADGRGLVPDAGHRDRRNRPRRPGHLPRARAARRLSDLRPRADERRRPRVRPAPGGGDDRRAGRLRRPGAGLRRPHRRLDRGRAADRAGRDRPSANAGRARRCRAARRGRSARSAST